VIPKAQQVFSFHCVLVSLPTPVNFQFKVSKNLKGKILLLLLLLQMISDVKMEGKLYWKL